MEMKRNKKILAILLAILMIISVISPTGASTVEPVDLVEAEQEGKITEKIDESQVQEQQVPSGEMAPEENNAETNVSQTEVTVDQPETTEQVIEDPNQEESSVVQEETEKTITDQNQEDSSANTIEDETIEEESSGETEIVTDGSSLDNLDTTQENIEENKEQTTTHIAENVTQETEQLKLNMGNAWYYNAENEKVPLEELTGIIDYSNVSSIQTVGLDVMYRLNMNGDLRTIQKGDWFEIQLPDIFENIQLMGTETYGSDKLIDASDAEVSGNIVKIIFKEAIEQKDLIDVHGLVHLSFGVKNDALTENISEYKIEIQEGNEYAFHLPAKQMSVAEAGDINQESIEKVKALFSSILTDHFADVFEYDLFSEEAENLIINNISTMEPDELEICYQQIMEAENAFGMLSSDESDYFIEAEPGLYHIIMEILSKIFTEMMAGGVAPMSLLPLEEKKAYLELTTYSQEELKQFPISKMLSLLQDENGDYIDLKGAETTVWKYEKDDVSGIESYTEYDIAQNDRIDLCPEDDKDSFQFEIIVGTGGQLNPNNQRYIVKAHVKDDFELDLELELYVDKENGTREKAIPSKCNYWVSTVSFNGGTEIVEELNYDFSFAGSIFEALGDQGEVRLNVKSELAKNPRVKIVIYPVLIVGSAYVTVKVPITDDILNQNMNAPGTGYLVSGKKNTDSTFMIEMYVDGKEYSSKYFCMRYWNWYPAHEGTLFVKQDNSRKNVFTNLQTDFDYRNKVSTLTFTLQPEYAADEEYYFDYDFVQQKNYGDGGTTNWDRLIKKVVIGHYDSIEEAEAANAVDVTDSIVKNGYLGNFGGDGIDFTVFKNAVLSSSFPLAYDTEADKITVKTVESNNLKWREFTDAPIIGEADPWFRITGAQSENGEVLDTYVVENGKNINIDTMYAYGYQTVFFSDNNIDSFIPQCETPDENAIYVKNVYANGKEYNEGDGLSFSKDSVQDNPNVIKATFSVVINDNNGSHTKQYNVQFVKKATEAKIYVSGPTAPEVRSVFLDEYFEYKHDIFIANMGDQDLTDLRVELDATNVALDSYWTIGGEGNDTLAACPDNFEAEKLSSSYGEMSNVAKIRLVPAGTEGGEIEGTLKIYSGDNLLETIILSGRAQNPQITTEGFENLVRYVPYSYIITTNNMYDWNSVRFSIVDESGEQPDSITFDPETGELSGEPLPDGMTLNSYTGELYGAPLEAGTYNFIVRADYGRDDYFEPSFKKLSITVLDNENEAVFLSSDDGFSIIPEENGENGYLGEQVSAYDFVLTSLDEDEVFISEGNYGEFVKLWLNGQLLEEGTDYTSEEGSTRITIKAQTLRDKTNDERNTISAEYNENGKRGENLKRTSQNFRVDLKTEEPDNPKPTEKPEKPIPTEKPVQPDPTKEPDQPVKPDPTKEPDQPEKPTPMKKPEQTGNLNSSPKPQLSITGTPSVQPETTEIPDGTDKTEPTATAAAEDKRAGQEAVTCIINVVDGEDQPVADLPIELHSDPQTAATDTDGMARFSGVEFGQHTVYVKNQQDEIDASRSFEIRKGSGISLDGDVITAEAGDTVTIKMRYEEGELTLLSAAERKAATPETGDNMRITFWCLCLVLSFGIGVVCYKRKLKNVDR